MALCLALETFSSIHCSSSSVESFCSNLAGLQLQLLLPGLNSGRILGISTNSWNITFNIFCMTPASPSNNPISRIKELRKNKGFQLPRPSGGNSDFPHKSKTHTLHNIAPETKKQAQLLFLRFLCKPLPLGMQIAGPCLQKALCNSFQNNSSNRFLFFFWQRCCRCTSAVKGSSSSSPWPPPVLRGLSQEQSSWLFLFFFFKQLRDPHWDV